MALACLFSLQGIPCLYYGTEQGLIGTDEVYDPQIKHGWPEQAREALWGKASAFDVGSPLYTQIKEMAEVRSRQPALRYGRQYFRPNSGNDTGNDADGIPTFGHSPYKGGVLAFSRILNQQEVVVVANTSTDVEFSGHVQIDARINDDSDLFTVLYSNYDTNGTGHPRGGKVFFLNRSGGRSDGWARRIYVKLEPMEVQILGKCGFMQTDI